MRELNELVFYLIKMLPLISFLLLLKVVHDRGPP